MCVPETTSSPLQSLNVRHKLKHNLVACSATLCVDRKAQNPSRISIVIAINLAAGLRSVLNSGTDCVRRPHDLTFRTSACKYLATVLSLPPCASARLNTETWVVSAAVLFLSWSDPVLYPWA